MDIIFNFFLWMRIAGIVVKHKPGVNTFLYLLGDKYMGKNKIKDALKMTTTMMSELLNYLNETGSMHIPPYVITARRIYDFVAVFGILKYNRLDESLFSPGMTLHLSSKQNSRLSWIV